VEREGIIRLHVWNVISPPALGLLPAEAKHAHQLPRHLRYLGVSSS
jgi:hypothetical protein